MNKAEDKYPDMPDNCPSCKKGKPYHKGQTNDVEPLTWWHCPSCETTGVTRLPENIKKGEGHSDEGMLTKTHPDAYELYNALSELKKRCGGFEKLKQKIKKAEECHEDPDHEKKEQEAASKIKEKADEILDIHKK